MSLIRWFLQTKQRIDQRKSEKRLRIYSDKLMRKKEKPTTGLSLIYFV
jgi:hypothetical protein